jgi:glycosyltransferase involved in cell wall biosynthesis
MKPPKISIITPSFNQGRYLEATIRSVLDQNYPNLEYIVMDGGSTDESVAILKRYEGQLAFWQSAPDGGQADAINRGFARSTGDIMAWLNSDDILLPGALARVAKAFANPTTNVITGMRKIVTPEGAISRNWYPELPVPVILQHICVVAQETTFWRRQVYEKIGPLDAGFHFALDYEYWQRMLANGYRFTFLPHFLAGFRKHPEAKTAKQKDVMARELPIIFQRYLGHPYSEKEAQKAMRRLRAKKLPISQYHYEKLRYMPWQWLQVYIRKALNL